MSSRRIEDLHYYLAAQYKKAVAEFEQCYPEAAKPILTFTYRSKVEQDALYAQGRTSAGPIVTNAKGGQSLHNYKPSFAFDIAFKKANGQLDWSEHLFKDFADILCRSPYIEWGGNWKKFKDRPHFQFKGFTWRMAAAGKQPNFDKPA